MKFLILAQLLLSLTTIGILGCQGDERALKADYSQQSELGGGFGNGGGGGDQCRFDDYTRRGRTIECSNLRNTKGVLAGTRTEKEACIGKVIHHPRRLEAQVTCYIPQDGSMQCPCLDCEADPSHPGCAESNVAVRPTSCTQGVDNQDVSSKTAIFNMHISNSERQACLIHVSEPDSSDEALVICKLANNGDYCGCPNCPNGPGSSTGGNPGGGSTGTTPGGSVGRADGLPSAPDSGSGSDTPDGAGWADPPPGTRGVPNTDCQKCLDECMEECKKERGQLICNDNGDYSSICADPCIKCSRNGDCKDACGGGTGGSSPAGGSTQGGSTGLIR
jgi:hypothetical protein